MIQRYDVFRRPGTRRTSDAPFVIVLQSHLVELDTVVVAPLLMLTTSSEITNLAVRVQVDESEYAVDVGELAPIPRRLLRNRVTNLLEAQDEIRRALDFLFEGF